jgi:uncharacterized protein
VYLVDTNIWLERLLEQTRSEEVGRFLERIPGDQLYLTDFTPHSIGIILTRLDQSATFSDFVEDVLINGSVHLVGLQPADMSLVTEAAKKYKLDFDDAYQYASADKFGLILVSFDSDFDRTPRRKQSPSEIKPQVKDGEEPKT